MIHKTSLKHYENWEEIAEEIGDLRYDALADFFKALSDKIREDGAKDKARGRHQLAQELSTIANKLEDATQASNIA